RDFHVTGVQTCALPISPPHQHRPVTDGGVAHGHPPAVLGPRPGPAPATADHRRRGLDLHHQLGVADRDIEHLEAGRAEPQRATTVSHQGPPVSRTVKQSRDSWRPPPHRWTLTPPAYHAPSRS